MIRDNDNDDKNVNNTYNNNAIKINNSTSY